MSSPPPWPQTSQKWGKETHQVQWTNVGFFPRRRVNQEYILQSTYLRVQTQEDEHEEEADGPQLGQRHHGHGLRVRNESQARAWETTDN